MKKYIGSGLLVFIFTFIALFLALDNKKETYAIQNTNCMTTISMPETNVLYDICTTSDLAREEEIEDNLGYIKTIVILGGLLIVVTIGLIAYKLLNLSNKKENK